MKNFKTVRRALCAFIAAAMLVSAAGCSLKKNDKAVDGVNSAKVIENYFKASELDAAIPFQYIQNMNTINGDVFMSGYASTSNAELVMGIYDSSSKTFKELDLSQYSDDISYPMEAELDGDNILFSYEDQNYNPHMCIIDVNTSEMSKDIELPADSYASGTFKDKNGDLCLVSMQYSAASVSTVINVYDKASLEFKSTVDINKELGLSESMVVVKMVKCSDGTYSALVLDPDDEQAVNLYKLSDEYKVINEIENAASDMEGEICNAYFKANGDFGLVTVSYDEETYDAKYFVNEFDLATGEVTGRYEPDFTDENGMLPFASLPGADVLVQDNGKILGYDFKENKSTELLNVSETAGKKFEDLYLVSSDGAKLLMVNMYYADGGGEITLRYNAETGETEKVVKPETKGSAEFAGILGEDYYYFETDYVSDIRKYNFIIADSEGNIKDTINIVSDKIDEDSFPRTYIVNEDGFRVAFDKYDYENNEEQYSIFLFDRNGNEISKIDVENATYVESMFTSADKSTTYVGYYNDGQYQIGTLNDESCTVENSGQISGNLSGICQGDDKYDIYYYTSEGVYGYNIKDDKETEIVNWIDSDLSIDIHAVSILGKDRILVSCFDRDTYEDQLYVLDRVDNETLKLIQNKQIITVAGMGISNGSFKEKVIDFNKSNDKYRVQINDYNKYSETDEKDNYVSGASKLNTDMAAGDIPDVIIGDYELDINSYASKGILTDLNKYIEKDGDISKSDYFENVFDLYSNDGKLCQIVTSFRVAGLAGTKEKLGEGTDWSYSDFFSLADQNQMFFMTGRDELTNDLICSNLSEFIDFSKKTCDFNNDNFIKLAELIKKEGVTKEEADDYYNNNKMDMNWHDDYQNRFKENKCMAEYVNIGSFGEITRFQQATIGGDAAFKGLPSDKASGILISADSTIGISSKSKLKDGAWEFVKSFLLEDYQDSMNEDYSDVFPVMRSSMTKLLDKAMKESDGDFITDMGYQSLNPIDRATGENLISLIESSSRKVVSDSKIKDIITEELDSFYSDGQSAEEAAANIQKKVSLFLKETK